MKPALTDKDIAALAAGVRRQSETSVEPKAEAAVEPKAETPAEPKAEAAVEPKAETPAEPKAEAAVEPKADTKSELITYLQGQVSEKTAENVRLQIELTGANAKLADVSASHGDLVAIAAQSVRNMKIALGFSASDMSAMSAQQVLAEHKVTATQFATAFPVGGVSAAAADEAAKTESKLDPNHAAMIAATTYK